jgi:mannose-1-phosphate guanylyltransferase / mannose-6-phosphate isomerase
LSEPVYSLIFAFQGVLTIFYNLAVMNTQILPVILSGGAGTRLWPVSREGHPKPFMKLADGQSLLEKTYLRAASLAQCLRIDGQATVLTVTNHDYYFLSRDVETRANILSHFLLEPCARNTAAAIALAAHQAIYQFGENIVLLILPADHLIDELQYFDDAVKKASALAEQGYLVTFGISPTTPETGFGYIECGQALGPGKVVSRFVEKPNLAKAQQFLSAGNYLWNSGMFCFEARTLLAQMEQYAPEIAGSAKACWNAIRPEERGDATIQIPTASFEKVPSISIDYALMERSDKVAVVEGLFAWNDIGSWAAVRDLAVPDASGNRALGECIFVDSSNTFVQSEDRLVATVGLKDVMIIDTSDALLVVDANRSQDVKSVVTELKLADHHIAKLHKTVARPWGTYTVLEEGPNFKIKRIEVKPKARLSLQMHQHRSEHWVVVSGLAKVVNGDSTLTLAMNESTYIPAGHKHRLENIGLDSLVVIEVQSGTYTGEDDIVRFDDEYGRQQAN